jgi:hypothetical protein
MPSIGQHIEGFPTNLVRLNSCGETTKIRDKTNPFQTHFRRSTFVVWLEYWQMGIQEGNMNAPELTGTHQIGLWN